MRLLPEDRRTSRAVAVGAMALGAVAVGALTIGFLAIGMMAIKRARIGRLEIDELVVRRIRTPESGKSREDGGVWGAGSR